jgi:hypothetical protein
MKQIIYLTLVLSAFGACKPAEEPKPESYKYYTKVNGAEWKTNYINDASVADGKVIENLYYSQLSKSISFSVRDAKSNAYTSFRIYIISPQEAVGKYSYAGDNLYLTHRISSFDIPSVESSTATFEITNFNWSINTGKISSFSGKFSGDIRAVHSDGIQRVTSFTEGMINGISE